MEAHVIAALLFASILHASWHALVKSTKDQVVSLAGMNLISTGTAAAFLPFVRPLSGTGYWIIAGSVALHFFYKFSLARLYRMAELGQAYPLARGLTPLMATGIAFLLLGEAPSSVGILGVACVCFGLVLLALESRGRGISIQTFLMASLTGLSVAGYSVVDAYGIRISGDFFSFTVWLMFFDGAAFIAYASCSRKKGALRQWANDWKIVLVSGWLGVLSFGIFMWALGRAPVGAVSALRETSVLFASLIGAFLLREKSSWNRFGAAVAVTIGVGTIALAR